MRNLVDFQILSESDEHITVMALDDDGYLWFGTVKYELTGALEADWQPIRGPRDDPPFMDTRDHLTRIEDDAKAKDADRERISERIGELPSIDGSDD